jgi:hypothetical protein
MFFFFGGYADFLCFYLHKTTHPKDLNLKTRLMKKFAWISLVSLPILGISILSFNLKSNVFNSNREIKNLAYQANEELNYRVHYGALNAAVVQMSVSKPLVIQDREAYNLKIEGQTISSFSWMFKVRDKFESWVDAKSHTPLRYAKTVREDAYFHQDVAVYNHKEKWLKNKEGKINITDHTMDVAAAIYYMRTFEYKDKVVGFKFPMDIYIDNKLHHLSVTYAGKEVIDTDLGRVSCIKLKPQLVVDRVFKDENAMTVWVSDDENHIPVRIQTDIYVGSLKVDITSFKNLKYPLNSLKKP